MTETITHPDGSIEEIISEIFTIRTNPEGVRYLKIKGRRGWPLRMTDGETPEDTVKRYEDKKFDRRTAASESREFSFDDAPADSRTDGDASQDDVPRKPRPDPLPRPRGAGRARGRVTSQSLERMLAEMLALPAIPAATFLHCQYCARHFASSSRQTARELVLLAEENEPLRRLLERMHDAWSTIGYASILGGYILKPLMHHIAPFEVRQAVGPFVGVPLNPKDHHHPQFMAQQQAAAQRMQEEQARAAQAAAQGDNVSQFPPQSPPDIPA